MNAIPLKSSSVFSQYTSIGFAGSATWPSHLGHTQVLKKMLTCGLFDLVIWYPSGFSSFKPHLADANLSIHRQQLANLAFPQEWVYRPKKGWAKLMLDLSATMGQEVPTIHRFMELKERYSQTPIFYVTGSDAVTEVNGVMPITEWTLYAEYLRYEQIRIIPRQGFAQKGEVRLPFNMQWLTDESSPDIRSSEIRQKIRQGDQSWRESVNPMVESYIDQHGLFLEDGEG